MRTCYAILVVVLIVALFQVASAQIPRTLSHQGVLCDSLGNPKPDNTYALTFRLYETSSGGTAIWTEQKNLTTKRGLFSTQLGDQVALGSNVRFDRPYWLSLQVGTSAEMSPRVPLSAVGYSFNAMKADTARYAIATQQEPVWQQSGNNIFYNSGNVGIGTTSPSAKLDVAGNVKIADGSQGAGKVLTSNASGVASWQTPAGGTHTIGESYGGGIVFYVYDNGQHGLIAATSDQSTGIQWYNGTYRYTGTTGDGLGAGAMNTALIVATQMADNQTGNFAAKVCADYSVAVGGITYGDWYLPSKYELNLLYQQRGVVGGFTGNSYWSSTETSNDNAWYQFFYNGAQNYSNKYYTHYVRAVRTF